MFHYFIAAFLLFSTILGANRWWVYHPLQIMIYLLIIFNIRKIRIFHPKSLLFWLCMLFFSMSIFSLLFSVSMQTSINEIFWFFLLFVYCVLIILYPLSDPQIIFILFCFIFTGTAETIFSFLIQLFSLNSFWKPSYYIAGTFVNHNHYTALLEMTIPITFFVLKNKKFTKQNRIYIELCCLIQMLGFILACSRTGWIAMTVSFFITYFLYFINPPFNIWNTLRKIFDSFFLTILDKNFCHFKYKILGFLTIILILFSVIPDFTSRVNSFQSLETDESLNVRLIIWNATWKIIEAHPLFGTGPGTYILAFPGYRPEGLGHDIVNHAHNEYLEIMSEYGIISCVIVLFSLNCLFFIKKKISTDIQKIVSPAFKFATLSLATHSLTDYHFHIPGICIFYVTFLGLYFKKSI